MPIPNEYTDQYEAKARQLGIYIQTGTFLESDARWPGHVFNTTCLVGPDGILLKYRKVPTWVPWEASAGATYDVTIDFADGSSTEGTGAFAYTVGTPDPPEFTELEYDEGPAGSLVTIYGTNLVGSGFAWPTVEFTGEDGEPHEALVYYAFGSYPGGGEGGGHGKGGPNALQGGFGWDGVDQILVEVPPDLEDGPYDVTVTVSGQEPEKAVVDFLYMNLRRFKTLDRDIFNSSYRFQNVAGLKARRLMELAAFFPLRKLSCIVQMFCEFRKENLR